MDVALDLPVHVGPVQLVGAFACVVAMGGFLIHSVGHYWAANRMLKYGLEQKRSTLKVLGAGFTIVLAFLGLDVIGEFPRPSVASVSSNSLIGWGSVGILAALFATAAVACSRHAAHHNH